MTTDRTPVNNNQFDDKSGRTWTINLTFGILRTIKSLGVDLGNLEQLGPVWGKILIDDELALSVVWKAIAATDISEDDWLSQMDGGTLEAAREALLGALRNFSPAKQAMIAAGAAKIHENYLKAIDTATEKIEKLTDEVVQRAMNRLNGKQSGKRRHTSRVSSAISTTNGRLGKRSAL